jgi:predicted RND superfamily exporter protein
MITTDIISYISNDLVVFSLAIITLMALILALIFKGIRWVLIPIGICNILNQDYFVQVLDNALSNE